MTLTQRIFRTWCLLFIYRWVVSTATGTQFCGFFFPAEQWLYLEPRGSIIRCSLNFMVYFWVGYSGSQLSVPAACSPVSFLQLYWVLCLLLAFVSPLLALSQIIYCCCPLALSFYAYPPPSSLSVLLFMFCSTVLHRVHANDLIKV